MGSVLKLLLRKNTMQQYLAWIKQRVMFKGDAVILTLTIQILPQINVSQFQTENDS